VYFILRHLSWFTSIREDYLNNQFTDQELAFRDEVRNFLKVSLPKTTSERVLNGLRLTKEQRVQWQKVLYDKGWIAPNWPVEFGGTGWSATQKYLFEHECAAAGAPEVIAFGLKMVGPVIYTYGTEQQKKRFLPDILKSDVWWCQGFSEAAAGSDLASLQTTATLDGDNYIVSGTKTWTTYAQHADWIFCLARSPDRSLKNQQAINFLLIKMDTPGIKVSPIMMLDGQREINEVHFDNVVVPAENLIGEPNKGWSYAKMLLTHERTNIAKVAISKTRLKNLRKMASEPPKGGVALIDDHAFALKLAELEIELRSLEYTEMRTLAAVSSGGAPGPESSILKIKGTEVAQFIDELYVEAAGYYCLPFVNDQFHSDTNAEFPREHHIGQGSETDRAPWYFNNRKASIYGGSNEVQKVIICKSVLGL
jgi:alkylation response protein AidB-like acyl-CoA dehydrogenase